MDGFTSFSSAFTAPSPLSNTVVSSPSPTTVVVDVIIAVDVVEVVKVPVDVEVVGDIVVVVIDDVVDIGVLSRLGTVFERGSPGIGEIMSTTQQLQ